MTQSDTNRDDAARLESALERIARAAHAGRQPESLPAVVQPDAVPLLEELKVRLDGLIADLRNALDDGASK